MHALTRALIFAFLPGVGSAREPTVTYIIEGPMMMDAGLASFVGPQIGGPIARLRDLDKRGNQRLPVRVNSKYSRQTGPFSTWSNSTYCGVRRKPWFTHPAAAGKITPT